ncbi:hypothetical protein DFH08DRAFT_871481 [Mycena albidolilacea]|uniref:Uncharacterized protein n=1 Tax=Mycena albidolilacea TaxID=1033008 RepID=A0AAD7EPJ4_9AGAR|nr:hypothetical protein DFH08DRAFT_871481 [Mycena albidolilacea]
MAPAQRLQQIILSQSSSVGRLTHPSEANISLRRKEKIPLEASLKASCRRSTWPKDSHLACTPHPILIDPQHDAAVRAIHEALVLAITSIVERWWTDTKANFSHRMPLEPQEEALLQWIDTLAPETLAPYRERLGSWRPDFLVESVPDPTTPSGTREQFRICEINAHFCWNGFLHTAYGQQALVDLGAETNRFVGATDPKQLLDGLFTLFDATKPLHLLKGAEPGLDIHMFADLAEQRTGSRPILVRPDDLRLIPDHGAKLGYRLYCVVRGKDLQDKESRNGKRTRIRTDGDQFVHNGEMLEEIHQIMRALSVRCFNGMRTIFLVHDKRMLGIVQQELDDLAEVLRAGICPTISAGSHEAALFLQRSPMYKDGYRLKLIRSGKGAGIVFGDELTAAEWEAKVRRYLSSATIGVDQPAYLVQRQIVQCRYDANYLIGTYHGLGGRYLGLGLWRSGPGRVCAISLLSKLPPALDVCTPFETETTLSIAAARFSVHV